MPVTRDQAQMIATLATNCRPIVLVFCNCLPGRPVLHPADGSQCRPEVRDE